jgi:uncharacterized membrane protein YphA (DoxX/SURF4 family)
MIIERRRILGGFAIFSLVLLRLTIGWHFFREGTKKVEYDGHDGGLRMILSADREFLDQAKGPLAPLYLAHSKSDHEWRSKLATPRKNEPPTKDGIEKQQQWAREYGKRRDEARKAGTELPVEFLPRSAAGDWAAQVKEDWKTAVNRFTAIPGMTAQQTSEAEKALAKRLDELTNYIRDEEENIAEYRHELWRLADWRKSPEAGDVPYVKQRITMKAGETAAAADSWREQVCQIGDRLYADLHEILTNEQRDQDATIAAVESALADPNQHKLDLINALATYVTIGVGICLVFGLFTRAASIIGALFLFGVIASQPFWIASAAPTMNQCVEMVALLVLAGTGAGRWAGMDGWLGALFGRRIVVVQDRI